MINKEKISIVKKYFGSLRIKINEPMKLHTSIRTGGPAEIYLEVLNQRELAWIILYCIKEKIPYFVLGSGTNLLVSDSGFEGLVIRNRTSKISLLNSLGEIITGKKVTDRVLLEVESGVLLNLLVSYALDAGYSGLEYFLGLPGTVGGAVWNNSHNERHHKYFGDLLSQAKIINKKGEIKKVNKSYFHFNYDYSEIQKNKDIILNVQLIMNFGNKKKLWEFATNELKYRSLSHQPGFTFGCTFKNISIESAQHLATPNFTTSAGYLLESAGLKGIAVGEAKISKQHANFILNKGLAKSSDVVKLINLCKDKIKAKYNIELEEEIVYLGKF